MESPPGGDLAGDRGGGWVPTQIHSQAASVFVSFPLHLLGEGSVMPRGEQES